MRQVKQAIIERDWPLSLFHDVGYIAAKETMDDENLWTQRADR